MSECVCVGLPDDSRVQFVALLVRSLHCVCLCVCARTCVSECSGLVFLINELKMAKVVTVSSRVLMSNK